MNGIKVGVDLYSIDFYLKKVKHAEPASRAILRVFGLLLHWVKSWSRSQTSVSDKWLSL